MPVQAVVSPVCKVRLFVKRGGIIMPLPHGHADFKPTDTLQDALCHFDLASGVGARFDDAAGDYSVMWRQFFRPVADVSFVDARLWMYGEENFVHAVGTQLHEIAMECYLVFDTEDHMDFVVTANMTELERFAVEVGAALGTERDALSPMGVHWFGKNFL